MMPSETVEDSHICNSTELSVETITDLCLKKFQSLSKTGKPTKNEWTVLSGVVLHDETMKCSKVVALGTGTKCVGQTKLCAQGLILNDSHAEVLARRALLRYFHRQLQLAKCDFRRPENLFVWKAEQRVYALRENVSFHFFSTQTPCGDACIEDNVGRSELPELTDLTVEIPPKRQKLAEFMNLDYGSVLSTVEETVYTGAKLIGTTYADPLQQVSGAVRLKPGRGDPTLSMSCSDKLSKWQLLGMQGALLDALLEQPIYMKTFNFCCESNCSSMERAIYKRWARKTFPFQRFHPVHPRLRYCTTNTFEFKQDAGRQPSPNGLVWCDIEDELKPFEISVNGKRQGVTTRKLHTPHAALKVSKFCLLQSFVSLLKSNNELLSKFGLVDVELEQVTYSQYKGLATSYQAAWLAAKQFYFEQWTQKPRDLLEFSINKVKAKKTS